MKESYEPDAGGLIDHYVGEIEDAWFSTDSRYNDGQTLLMFWKMQTDNVDVPELEERFSCGRDWESMDGGKTAEHPQGKNKFHPSSLYGKIIQRSVNEFGIRELLESRGESYEAAIWPGLRFEMSREAVDYGGEIGKKDRILPQRFMGVVGDGGDGAPAPSPAAPAPVTSILDELDPALVEQLKALRADSTSHPQFVDRCMDLQGVIGNDKLVRAIATEDQLWRELSNG